MTLRGQEVCDADASVSAQAVWAQGSAGLWSYRLRIPQLPGRPPLPALPRTSPEPPPPQRPPAPREHVPPEPRAGAGPRGRRGTRGGGETRGRSRHEALRVPEQGDLRSGWGCQVTRNRGRSGGTPRRARVRTQWPRVVPAGMKSLDPRRHRCHRHAFVGAISRTHGRRFIPCESRNPDLPNGVQDPRIRAMAWVRTGPKGPGVASLRQTTSAPPPGRVCPQSPLATAPIPGCRFPSPQKEVRQTGQTSLRSGWLIWKGHLSSQGHVVLHELWGEVARGSLRR